MNIEQTKEAIRVMQAFVDGKELEWRYRGIERWETIISPKWNWIDNEYRIKPTPTLRPWTADEVPLGAQMRRKTDRHRFLIGSVANDGSRKEWLEHNEHSTDGGKTWKECGVMEEAK
jgi:hypothetical protein